MYASKQITIVAVIMLALFFLSSCGWKADGNARLEEQYPTPGDEDEDQSEIPELELDGNEAETLGGVWAMQMVLPGTISPLIDPWDIILTNLFIATIDEEESTLSLRFCDQIVELEGAVGDIGKTEVPDALKEALGNTPIEIELPGDLSLPAKKLGWPWGVTLDDPINDKIADIDAEDNRVFDQDDDDLPGVTMRVLSPAGERYMVRRAVWDMAAGDVSEDLQWIHGTLDFRVDEVAIGASSSLLETVAPITPSEAGGTFALRRMSAADIAADGDSDKDTDSDGDQTPDGDIQMDGDAVPDGDTTTDGDVEIETEIPVDGDRDDDPELAELDSDGDKDQIEMEIDSTEADGDVETETEGEDSLKIKFKAGAGGYNCERLIREYKAIFATTE